MPIVGMTIKSVEAKRVEDYNGNSQIANQTNLGVIREQEFGSMGKKGMAIPFEFRSDYLTDLKKSFANIVIIGEIYIVDSEKDRTVEEWKKNKKLSDDANVGIINTILRRCIIKAVSLSDELQLPPPISFPIASKGKPQQEESRYIG